MDHRKGMVLLRGRAGIGGRVGVIVTGAQAEYRIRFERGESGLRAVAADASVIVIVDVLSFSTAVDVAVGAGSRVRAARPSDDIDAEVKRFGALRGVPRNECTPATPHSLSPDSLADLPLGSRIVLPSPNGASLIACARELGRATVIAGCLRNASAIAAYINARASDNTWASDSAPASENARASDEIVAIVAAGERWPDGSLRPALEDDLGAGAILASLEQRSATASPEARVVARSFVAGRLQLADDIRASVSGRELSDSGFRHDVERALEVDASRAVPMLQSDGFLSARQ